MKLLNLFILAIFVATTCCARDWSILMYVEATNHLQPEAIKNVTDLLCAGVRDHNHVSVVIHARGHTAWQYRIQGHSLVFEHEILFDEIHYNNIIPLMADMVTKYPADHYGIVLWNHGFGILSPEYNALTNDWTAPLDGSMDMSVCDIRRSVNNLGHSHHKGMLVNLEAGTFLDNTEMVALFRTISQDILHGNKLDLLGMDMCMGAMLEIGYQLRSYVSYMVGSQDCELKDGWDYKALGQQLHERRVSPEAVAQSVVYAYQDYYEPRAPIGRYTQSAINLAYIQELKELHDAIAQLLQDDMIMPLIKLAREECPRFCYVSAYTDLYLFYRNLYDLLDSVEQNERILLLQKLLLEGEKLIQRAVVATVAGKLNRAVQGISIYFPRHEIHDSYCETEFAMTGNWLNFLENFVDHDQA